MTTSDRDDSGGALSENAGKIAAVLMCALVALLTMSTIAEQLGAARDTIDAVILGAVMAVAALLAWAAGSSDPCVLTRGGELPPAIGSWAGLGVLAPGGALLALAGWHFRLGFDGLAFIIGPLAGLTLAAVLIAPWLAGSRASTVAGFLGLRYGAAPRLLGGIVALAVSGLIAAAGLTAAAGLASQVFGLSPALALALTAVAALALTLPGGAASTSWAALALAIVALAAILVTAGAVAIVHEGQPVPQIGYGATLAAISGLERTMIEEGLASAQILKPHTKPFLNIDALGFAALVLSLATGTAVLPQHLARVFDSGGRREARATAVGTLLLALLVAITVPALAAYAKKDLHQTIAARTPLASLPTAWEAPSRQDLVRIHGVSLGLFEAVANAAKVGAGDPAAVAEVLAREDAWLAARWTKLKDPVRALLIDKSRAAAGATPDASWQAYREMLLPALAAASGNKPALLTLAAVEIEPEAAILALPTTAGLPHVLSSLFTAGLLAAALAMTSAALAAAAAVLAGDVLGTLRGSAPDTPPGALAYRLALGAAALSATGAAALSGTTDLVGMLPLALSLAAAALFPALVLGILWKRGNVWGATLGMIAGLAVALYYTVGVLAFPVAFSETWAALSNASPAAARKLSDLSAAVAAAAGEEARALASAALDAHARGTLLRPGTANWLGISPLASALFALPVGLAVMLVLSLVTPRPGEAQQAFIDRIRRPGREP